MFSKKQIKKEIELAFEAQKTELEEIIQNLNGINERTTKLLSGADTFSASISGSIAQLDDKMQLFKRDLINLMNIGSNTRFGPNFVPAENFFAATSMQKAYQAATVEALRIYNLRGIQTWVTLLEPYHLGYLEPILKETQQFTMKNNCAFFPYGVINNDPEIETLEWYYGNQMHFIADWFVKEIYNYVNKTGLYLGNLEAYIFRGEQEFTLKCISNIKKLNFNIWLKAYVVIPALFGKTQIIQEITPSNEELEK